MAHQIVFFDERIEQNGKYDSVCRSQPLKVSLQPDDTSGTSEWVGPRGGSLLSYQSAAVLFGWFERAGFVLAANTIER